MDYGLAAIRTIHFAATVAASGVILFRWLVAAPAYRDVNSPPQSRGASLIDPVFDRQLGDILRSLETDLEICLAPQITAGSRVKIKSGALRGMEGWVEHRSGTVQVQLRLDFIGQAAAVKIEATELELV